MAKEKKLFSVLKYFCEKKILYCGSSPLQQQFVSSEKRKLFKLCCHWSGYATNMRNINGLLCMYSPKNGMHICRTWILFISLFIYVFTAFEHKHILYGCYKKMKKALFPLSKSDLTDLEITVRIQDRKRRIIPLYSL